MPLPDLEKHSIENPEKDSIEIWKKIIDVQIHFNDIKSKNQTLFVSVVTASMIGSGYLFKNNGTQSILFMYLYSLPILGAAIFTAAFFILDYGIYHHLLKGSVECGKEFEKKHLKKKLTSIWVEEVSERSRTLGIRGSGTKLIWFYILIFLSLIFAFVIINLNFWLDSYCQIRRCFHFQ